MWVEVHGGGGKKNKGNKCRYNMLKFVDGNNLSPIPVLNSNV